MFAKKIRNSPTNMKAKIHLDVHVKSMINKVESFSFITLLREKAHFFGKPDLHNL